MRWTFLLAALLPLPAQETSPELRTGGPRPDNAKEIAAGTKVPLTLLNTLSSKQTAEGDRVYLETLYPILVGGKIVIPPGSYVSGTVTQVKRPGRIKGRGELYLRFDSLTLPNGVTRDFRARIGGMEGGGNNELDRGEGKIKGGGSKGEDARDIAQAAQMGGWHRGRSGSGCRGRTRRRALDTRSRRGSEQGQCGRDGAGPRALLRGQGTRLQRGASARHPHGCSPAGVERHVEAKQLAASLLIAQRPAQLLSRPSLPTAPPALRRPLTAP
jgi:hypothetical protein